MNRRNFLQSFVLTLLTLLFGPKVVAALTEEQVEEITVTVGGMVNFEVGQKIQLSGGTEGGTFTITAVDTEAGTFTVA